MSLAFPILSSFEIAFAILVAALEKYSQTRVVQW